MNPYEHSTLLSKFLDRRFFRIFLISYEPGDGLDSCIVRNSLIPAKLYEFRMGISKVCLFIFETRCTFAMLLGLGPLPRKLSETLERSLDPNGSSMPVRISIFPLLWEYVQSKPIWYLSHFC